jgi:hypothetical protein
MVNAPIGGFRWSNCNHTEVPMYISSFSIQPNAIISGTETTTSFVAEVTEDIGTTNFLKVNDLFAFISKLQYLLMLKHIIYYEI